MFIKHSNKPVAAGEMAVVIHSVGKVKAGTIVQVIRIKGEVAEVSKAFDVHNHFIPLCWMVWVP